MKINFKAWWYYNKTKIVFVVAVLLFALAMNISINGGDTILQKCLKGFGQMGASMVDGFTEGN